MLKRIFIRATISVACLGAALCTTEDDTLLTPGEANLQILAAYAAKDLQCDQTHVLTIPVFTDASAESVGLCVFDLLGQSCDVWGSAENLPLTCLAISVSF
ncbi:MAG: hypothetical protein RIF32_16160 [Leptospirales bacterium]|jgi:hypothetical protein